MSQDKSHTGANPRGSGVRLRYVLQNIYDNTRPAQLTFEQMKYKLDVIHRLCAAALEPRKERRDA